MNNNKKQQLSYQIRKNRVKKAIMKGGNTPRLSVFKSEKYLYAQIIDDLNGVTICQSSNIHHPKTTAEVIGADLSKKAQANKITKVVFDRGKNSYHGKIKVLADSARKAGLIF